MPFHHSTVISKLFLRSHIHWPTQRREKQHGIIFSLNDLFQLEASNSDIALPPCRWAALDQSSVWYFTRDFAAQMYFFLKTSSFTVNNHGLEAFLHFCLIYQNKMNNRHPTSRERLCFALKEKHIGPRYFSPKLSLQYQLSHTAPPLAKTTPRGHSSPMSAP